MKKIILLIITCYFPFINSLSAQDKAVTIVVLGSSTAAGSGPSDSDNTWVNRYRRYIQSVNSQSSVINLAKGGYRTYNIMPTGYIPPSGQATPDDLRNITKALNYNPDAIIINLPSNDAFSGIPVTDQLRNYDTIMKHANTANVPVWISTTQPRSFDQIRIKLLTDMRDSTYTHFGDKALDFWTEIATENNTINPIYDSGDNVHLNDAAHGILFQRVVDAEILEFLSDSYLQAEKYISASGVDIFNDFYGNSGDGFIRFAKNTGASATYKLISEVNKSVDLTFRYSNKNSITVARLFVNGNIIPETLNFMPTGSEEIWNRIKVTINLLEGENSVEVRCSDEGGSVCLDFISWKDPQVSYPKSSLTGNLSGIINIDCGSNQNLSTPNWNNFTAANNNPDSKIKLIDSKGNTTGIIAYVNDIFSAVNTSGTTTPDASLEIPATASSDSYYGHTEEFNGKVVPKCSFIFENLETDVEYDFKIFASREATDNRDTKYTIVGSNSGTANLNVANSTYKMAVINNIVPDDHGRVTLSVEKGANNTNSYGFFYIGAIRILYDSPLVTDNNELGLDIGNINVYPVPFYNTLSVANVPLHSIVSVYSSTGDKVFELIHNKGGTIFLDTSGYAEGIYILRISNEDLLFKSFKVIKTYPRY